MRWRERQAAEVARTQPARPGYVAYSPWPGPHTTADRKLVNVRAMTADEREKPGTEHELAASPGSWAGPVGGFLLMLSGLGLLLWGFLGRSSSSPSLIYQAAKVVAIGLVVTGTTLVARRRDSSRRPDAETEPAPRS